MKNISIPREKTAYELTFTDINELCDAYISTVKVADVKN